MPSQALIMRSRSRSPCTSPSHSPSPSPSRSSIHSPSRSPSNCPTPDRRRREDEEEGEEGGRGGGYERQSRRYRGTRVHVGSLARATSVRELRTQFRKFGDIVDVWMARTQPCFAFIVFRHREDALQAVKRMDGETLHSRRMRVTMARPRTKGTRSGAFNPYLRCYQCGKRGHFSRDCRAHQWSPSPSDIRAQRREERYRYDSRYNDPRHARRSSTSGSATYRRQ